MINQTSDADFCWRCVVAWMKIRRATRRVRFGIALSRGGQFWGRRRLGRVQGQIRITDNLNQWMRLWFRRFIFNNCFGRMRRRRETAACGNWLGTRRSTFNWRSRRGG
jgi:hypothetical protein